MQKEKIKRLRGFGLLVFVIICGIYAYMTHSMNSKKAKRFYNDFYNASKNGAQLGFDGSLSVASVPASKTDDQNSGFSASASRGVT